jgi:PPOX class probable F420-dependent enzyme
MQKVPGSHRDLLKAQFATLATVGASGRPQQSVVWFLAEGDDIGISLSNSRQKTANLQRNPTCSLLILDPTNSFRYLEVRGQAKITADEGYVFATKVGAKYGADLRQYDAPGDTRLIVTIVPERVRAVDMSG